ASWDCVSPVTNCVFDALVQAGTACLTRMIFESNKWTATVKNLKQDRELTTGSGATYDDIRITSGKPCRNVNDEEDDQFWNVGTVNVSRKFKEYQRQLISSLRQKKIKLTWSNTFEL
ncbi:2138_t:CDS:2, partial [Paraglomus occultum]